MDTRRTIKPPLLFYLIYTAVALLLTLILELTGIRLFEAYLGAFSPPIAVALVGTAGWFALWLLLKTERLSHAWEGAGAKLYWAAAAGIFFGVVLIPVDLGYRLPAALNAPFPGSLIFYPVLCLAVEVIFHLLPFTVLYIILSKTLLSHRPFIALLASAAVAAAIEPVYQISLPFLSAYPVSLSLIVLLFSALLNATQLFFFAKYGFAAMVTLRLTQYLVWHIIWGILRLQVL